MPTNDKLTSFATFHIHEHFYIYFLILQIVILWYFPNIILWIIIKKTHNTTDLVCKTRTLRCKDAGTAFSYFPISVAGSQSCQQFRPTFLLFPFPTLSPFPSHQHILLTPSSKYNPESASNDLSHTTPCLAWITARVSQLPSLPSPFPLAGPSQQVENH